MSSLKDNPLELYPQIFARMKEINNLSDAEQTVFSKFEDDMNELAKDRFFLSASEEATLIYEKGAGIVANKTTEDLDFRRQRALNRYYMMPPYTIRWLVDKLNEIIGIGKWHAYLNAERTELAIESTAVNHLWFEEIRATIEKIKPITVIFVNKPTAMEKVVVMMEGACRPFGYNYNLGRWKLGSLPFATFEGGKNLGGSNLINDNLKMRLSKTSAESISKAVLNDIMEITDFITLKSDGNKAIVEYDVSPDQLASITNIKLVAADGSILTDSAVFVPMISNVQIKHEIIIEGGEISGT